VILLILHGHINHGHFVKPTDAPSDDEILFSEVEIQQVTLLVCGAVAMTIVINGMFAKPLFNFLYRKKIGQEEGAEAAIFHYVQKRLKKKAADLLEDLKEEIPVLDKATVRDLCPGVFDEEQVRVCDPLCVGGGWGVKLHKAHSPPCHTLTPPSLSAPLRRPPAGVGAPRVHGDAHGYAHGYVRMVHKPWRRRQSRRGRGRRGHRGGTKRGGTRRRVAVEIAGQVVGTDPVEREIGE
jgi:hypothetical protein